MGMNTIRAGADSIRILAGRLIAFPNAIRRGLAIFGMTFYLFLSKKGAYLCKKEYFYLPNKSVHATLVIISYDEFAR